MSVHFNGAVFRSNSYSVGGILRVSADGTGPRFTRISANPLFKQLESRLTWLVGTALALEALSEG